MSSNSVARRVKALRVARHLTQERLAELAGLGRTKVVKIESGANGVSTTRVRDGIARATGASFEDFSEYLAGTIELEELLERAERSRTGPRVLAFGALSARPDYERHLVTARARWPHIPDAAWAEVGAMCVPAEMPVSPDLLLDLAQVVLRHRPSRP